ncbi:hypothetical protein [Actinomyces viscosus]|uniref:hypothetical protein n=1 Tax=Actinomyces viscosus TaxID=1656 RepID=UPI0010705199|nr:hypothetical protein [Actinomyces viscosus]
MFTDTGPGEFAREISAKDGGKNYLSLTAPASALTMLFGAVFGFGEPDSVFEIVCGSISAFFLLVIIVSLLPISLPVWMYPQWHVEWRRRRRRERVAGESSWRDTARLGPGGAAGPATGHADTLALPGSAAMNLSSDSPGDDI